MGSVDFKKTSAEPVRFDKKLGICFGWFCFSKKGGAEYDDAHGDHFPDDELLVACDALMAKPAGEREINVEHAGAGRGSIATAVALTEDVVKASKPAIDTGGTYGIWGSFRPDAELLKSIEAGEAFCLSIEGKAHEVETIAKSASGATGRKRIMRKVELTKLAVVKAGAHEDAAVTLIKSAPPDPTAVEKVAVSKRTPAMTTAVSGHAHSLYDIDDADGRTSWESMPGDQPYTGHSHPFVRSPDGSIVIGEAAGHSHTLATSTETTAMTDVEKTAHTAEIQKRDARIGTLASLLLVAATLPTEQAAYAKSLPAEKLEGFLAKSEVERVALVAPVYKAADGTCYFASDDPRMVALAKSDDAKTAEIAKAKEREEVVRFEKRAQIEVPNLPGKVDAHAFLLRAIEQTPGDAEVKKAALATVTAASMAYGEVFKAQGSRSTTEIVEGSPIAELEKAHAAFAKTAGKSLAETAGDFARSEQGQRLYAAAYPYDRPRA